MGIVDELKRLAHPYEDEDELDDGYDEYEEDELEEAEPEPKPSFRSKRAEKSAESAPRFQRDQSKVVPLNNASNAAMQVVLVQPGRPGCAVDDIANHLIEKHTVVLNLQRTKEADARRLLDFLQGVVYPIHAKITAAADNTYLITPYNVDVSGSVEGLKSDNASLFDQAKNGFFF